MMIQASITYRLVWKITLTFRTWDLFASSGERVGRYPLHWVLFIKAMLVVVVGNGHGLKSGNRKCKYKRQNPLKVTHTNTVYCAVSLPKLTTVIKRQFGRKWGTTSMPAPSFRTRYVLQSARVSVRRSSSGLLCCVERRRVVCPADVSA